MQAEFASQVLQRTGRLMADVSDTRDEVLLTHPLFVEFFRDIQRLKEGYS
jgi:hypothetical protein